MAAVSASSAIARGLEVGAVVGNGIGFSQTGDLWWLVRAGGEQVTGRISK